MQSKKIPTFTADTSVKSNNIFFIVFVIIYHGSLAFSQSTSTKQSFSISENATVGTIIGSLPAAGVGSFLVIDEPGNVFRDYVDVDRLESDGVIVIKSKFDHESKSLFDFIVYDTSNSNYYQVEINVLDVNDNYPTFPASAVTLVISEASQVGSKFDIGSATDPDSFPYNVQGYRIVTGNSDHSFRVDSRHFNDFVFADLIVNKTLNREEISLFHITIEAFDGGFPSKTGTIQVQVNVSDVNDNAPTFDLSRYTVAVMEDAPIGTDVITMNATDPDIADNGKITYRIDRTNSDPDSFFVIDAISGVISLNKRLDYERALQHKIVVEAVDRGTEPQVGSTVVIVTVVNVNDNYPILSVIFLDANESKISEAAQVGDYLARVSVSDPDSEENVQINLTLTGGNGRFDLEQVTNETYLVAVRQELDREADPSFDITLTAQDIGSPSKSVSASFTITIEDVNDNPPRFNKDLYEVTPESTLAGSFVTQLQATDEDTGLNAEIRYSLTTSNQSEWFAINPSSGLVTTRRVLNSAINSSPRLVVIATDKGVPPLSARTTVLVKLAEPAPDSLEFEESLFSFVVSENISNGSCIGQVPVVDRSSTAVLTYSIVSPINLPFEIAAATGDLCMTSLLDKETTSSYEFEVQVHDETFQSDHATVHVTVTDVNEFPPVFHPIFYLVNIKRDATLRFPVTRVMATDADDYPDNQITYLVARGNEKGLFDLDSTSGQISVNKSLGNLEMGSNHDVTIVAVDERGLRSEENALVVITVVDGDILEGGPFFSSTHYHFTIEENAPFASYVGSVEAVSSDGSSVQYQIRRDPPATSWFLVDSTSGDVIVDGRIDREIFANVTFQVVASSGTPSLYSLAFVSITINDVNDNAPHFYGSLNGILPPLTVPFTLEIGTEVEMISVVDNDDGANGTVEYYLSSHYFMINFSTGILRLKAPLELFSENYNLLIESRDLGQPPLVSTASKLIRARTLDPNCPVLARKVHRFRIPENFPLSMTFGTVGVAASNPSSRFLFHIAGTTSVPFALFPNGSLYLDLPVDYELKSSYEFSISVRGFPSSPEFKRFCTAVCDVIVSIDDVNDNAPQFSKPVYDFHVTEGLPPGSQVGKVRAFDRDSSRNAQITYRFALRNMNFDLHPTTGMISTLSSLDCREFSHFTLDVEASDDVNLSRATLQIYVDDVNDNFPRFLSETLRFAVVPAYSKQGTWVADMAATDDDAGSNALLSYTIDGSQLFAIDQISGTVTTRSILSNTSLGVRTLSVTVTDGGIPSRSSSITLKVNIRPSSSNPFKYSETQFVFTPMEDAVVGTIIGSFEPTSPSRRRRDVTSLPVFRVVSGNGRSFFAVNESTGDVVLKKKLDYITSPQRTISVEKQTSTGLVTLNAQINIRDTNDHAPVFASGTFFIGVDENASLGKQIWRFIATDDDLGLNGRVKYSVVTQSPLPGFVVNRDTGALLVNSTLDREATSEYLLVIKATDSSVTLPRFSTASCIVTVRDVNDNPPRFINRPFASITEDAPIGVTIIRFLATDPDAGANGHVTFSIASSDEGFFHLDATTGVLTLARNLDFEQDPVFNLNVSATDGAAGNPLTTFQNFVINVNNLNDLSPQFERLFYQAEVAEEQRPGIIVTRVKADDGDAGVHGGVRYFLQQTSDNKNFKINSENGIITTTASLDREEKPSFLLTVFAVDNSTPPLYGWTTVNVTVTDVNDNNPTFSSLDGTTDPPTLIRLEIVENSSVLGLIHLFAACDRDYGENARITFSIEGGDENKDFILNATTGQFYAARVLDREKTSSYRLVLVATDHGNPPRTAVGQVLVTVLDWNDHDPNFTRNVYEANVTESLSSGQYVDTVQASDPDDGLNGAVQYYLAPPSSSEQLSGLFEIDVNTGLVTTTAALDRERKALYRLAVVAVDSSPYNPRSSTASLIIHVLDVNDNTPLFDESVIRLNVSRDARPNSVVGHVTAQDYDEGLNSLISYRFSSSSEPNSYFAINSSSGDLKLVRQLAAAQSPFFLSVLATDQGNPRRSSEAVLVISIEGEQQPDAHLEFDRTFFDVSIWENVQKHFPVIQVQPSIIGTSSNTTEVMYQVLYGNERGRPFSISQNGAITVSNPSLLDFETRPNIPLSVIASTPNASTPIYGFTTVNVHLRDDNDNQPRCSQSRYYTRVLEEQNPSFLMQVFATDEDSGENGEIRFDIASGDPDNVFSLNSFSGFLNTRRNLDREIHDKYELIVFVTDLGETRKTGTCTVQVDVIDVNDHDPILVVPSNPILIPENMAVGSLVTTVTANDVDVDPYLIFSISPPNGSFNIDRNGGQIFLTSSLNFETARLSTLTIEASDGLRSDSSVVQVIVTDVNDNRPSFDEPLYLGSINESSPVGTPVVTVRATDLDSDDNGRISYRILNVLPDSSLFKIDNSTGVISTNQRFVFTPQFSLYNLEVEAYDHGHPVLSQSVGVRIEIININNNPPQFARTFYEVEILESSPRGSYVINLTATDADFSIENTNVYYEIVAGNQDEAFKIDTYGGSEMHSIGVIRIAQLLDHESRDSYELVVTAFDSGNPQLSNNVTVRVRVLDVDDNLPHFNASLYHGTVPENNEGTKSLLAVPVLPIYATDADEGSLSNLKFEIISGNDDDAFELQECDPPATSCAHLYAKVIDFERMTQYRLTVQVTDVRASLRSRSSTAQVIVDVQNMNEHQPSVVSFRRVVIDEPIPSGQILFYIHANDDDAGDLGHITFNVTNDGSRHRGNDCLPPDGMFVIDDLTGAVKAVVELDYEKCQMLIFEVGVCDPDQCSSTFVELHVTPVDEFSPQFVGIDQSIGFHFFVPYGSRAGYIVGTVNATDQDSDEDARIHYILQDNSGSNLFHINPIFGIISLSRDLDSSSSYVLLLTAESTNQRSTTRVTIAVTDAPLVAGVPYIIAIVFGVVAVLVFIIVVIVYVKRRKKKRLHKDSNSSIQSSENDDVTQEKRDNDADMRRSKKFHNFSNDRSISQQSASMNRQQNYDDVNGALHDFLSNQQLFNGKGMSDFQKKRETTALSNRQDDAIAPDKQLHRCSTKTREPAVTGNDESAEDEEVTRITSTPSSFKKRSSFNSQLFGAHQRVADSGIQQDMDKISDKSEQHFNSKSFENTREPHTEAGGALKVTLPVLPPSSAQPNTGGCYAPAEHSYLPDGKKQCADILACLDSLEERRHSAALNKPVAKGWKPEFEPLSSVFTEFARLRDESEEDLTQKTIFPDIKPVSPPPLTSLPPQNDNLSVPVPKLRAANSGPDTRPDGLILRPNPQYSFKKLSFSSSQRAQHNAAPPPYSQVISNRPGSGSSVRSRGSRLSLHSQRQIASLPFNVPNFTSYASSLSHRPSNYHSSVTSPAMSPNLSPSLSPLTTHSPPPGETTGKRGLEGQHTAPSLIKVIRTQSKDASSRGKRKERMVRV